MTRQVLAAAALMLGLAAAFVDRGSASATGLSDAGSDAGVAYISAPELADRIMQADGRLRLFDVRARAEYDALHIPTARHATLASLVDAPFSADAAVVIYGNGHADGVEAWTRLRGRGRRGASILREGIYEWLARVHEPVLAADATADERAAFERAAERSRFFGGQPRSGVARDEIPVGYWTTGGDVRAGEMTEHQRMLAGAAGSLIARVRRRGC